MKEQFVTHTLALKLKELGFDEECLARYCVVTKWEKPTGEVRLQITNDCPSYYKTLFKAPLYQQAIEFLLGKLGKSYLVAFSDMDYRLLKWDNEEENFNEEGSTNSKDVLIEWLIEEVEKLVQISNNNEL